MEHPKVASQCTLQSRKSKAVRDRELLLSHNHASTAVASPPTPLFIIRPASDLGYDISRDWVCGERLPPALVVYDDQERLHWHPLHNSDGNPNHHPWLPPYFYSRLPESLQKGFFNHPVYAGQPPPPLTWTGKGGRVVAWLYMPGHCSKDPPYLLYEEYPAPPPTETVVAKSTIYSHANPFSVLGASDLQKSYAAPIVRMNSSPRPLPHLPNEILIEIWSYAAEMSAKQGLEYPPIPLSTNGRPKTKNGYLLNITPLLKGVEPFNLLHACRSSRMAMFDALLEDVGIVGKMEPAPLSRGEGGRKEDVLLFIHDPTRGGVAWNTPEAVGFPDQ